MTKKTGVVRTIKVDPPSREEVQTRKIQETLNFLRRVVEFIIPMVAAHGKTVLHTIRQVELNPFLINLQRDTIQSCETTLVIHYKNDRVLELRYFGYNFDPEHCEVRVFDQGPLWIAAFEEKMRQRESARLLGYRNPSREERERMALERWRRERARIRFEQHRLKLV